MLLGAVGNELVAGGTTHRWIGLNALHNLQKFAVGGDGYVVEAKVPALGHIVDLACVHFVVNDTVHVDGGKKRRAFRERTNNAKVANDVHLVLRDENLACCGSANLTNGRWANEVGLVLAKRNLVNCELPNLRFACGLCKEGRCFFFHCGENANFHGEISLE